MPHAGKKGYNGKCELDLINTLKVPAIKAYYKYSVNVKCPIFAGFLFEW